MKKTKSSLVVSILISSLVLTSCGGAFGPSYRKVTSAKVLGAGNSYPPVSTGSISSHTSRIRTYQRKGFIPLGESTIVRRGKLSEDHARQLVQAKKGDLGIMSSSYLGQGSERVAVPVRTTTYQRRDVAAGAYANNRGYRSAAVAEGRRASESTEYVYQTQIFDLWKHKATVMVHKNRLQN